MEGDSKKIEVSANVSHENHKRGDNGSIQTENPEISLVTSIRKKLQTVSALSSRCCIHKVPTKLHKVNDAAYTPQVISIGPFYHGKESLQVMEEHKWRYLGVFLDRYRKIDLEDYVKALKEWEESARQCYAEPTKLGSDGFVEMMLLDGFFILVLFLQIRTSEWQDKSDPIFHTTWMLGAILRDMLLLENQIPFFVLERLFQLSEVPNQDDELLVLLKPLACLCFSYFQKMDKFPETTSRSSAKHLLDFVRNCLLSSPIVIPQDERKCDVTRSATELHEVGVKFKVSKSNCLMDIRFRNGVLEIPHLKINQDSTESLFRNLTALEQCQEFPNSEITSYASLMDSLINTPKDVELLIRYGIIVNGLGDNGNVSHLFNNLLKEVNLPTSKFYFSGLCEELNAYCKMRRHKWMASLKRDYFNSPWAVVSFTIAFVLLILTVAQALFSFIPRKNPCSFTMAEDLKRMGASATISEKHDRGDNASIQTENPDVTLATFIQQKLNMVLPISSVCSIHKVPMMLRSINEATYIPRVISIGPFHRGKKSLQEMEKHKWRYFAVFREWYPERDLKDYVKGLRGLEERARQCYAETIELGSNDFIEMMLLDGFFILVLFLKKHFKIWEDNSDPIYNTRWMWNAVMIDMMLLENQIPFFVLEGLFNLSFVTNQDDDENPSLLKLTHGYFKYFFESDEIPETISKSQVTHLLDFVRSCHLPSSTTVLPQSQGGKRYDVTRSATELHEAGVKFKVGESNCLLDISFTNGELEIPYLQIVDGTESLFRNLIALEQCQRLSNSGITSYASLMDSLINTPKDVSLLIDNGIIENRLGDNEEVSRLFNNLVKEVAFGSDEFYFSSLCGDLDAYCKKHWHKWMASLRHDYFNTPWAIISFSAAVVLLILTFLQTGSSFISKS
ncbi:hypothetical protein HHK36_025745 [Tetracentron sinense]|uniref:Uncharacterized protein n=1 Tax=Tetracentron sinense TaxID=13715 RepID=A0A834YJC0_TETSI|nr:hypothetical protein HHK36_025745 [Tetracentron sinense]